MKNISDYPEIIKTEEIMEIFNISRAAAYRLMKTKDFPSFKSMGHYIVQKKSLIKWLDKQENLAYKYK